MIPSPLFTHRELHIIEDIAGRAPHVLDLIPIFLADDDHLFRDRYPDQARAARGGARTTVRLNCVA